MTSTRKHLIATRAYEIWEQDGRPEGRQEEHWLRGEKELAAKLAPLPEAAAADPARNAPVAGNYAARVTRPPRKAG